MPSFADRLEFGEHEEWNDFPSTTLLPSPGAASPDFVAIPGTGGLLGAYGFSGAGATIEALSGTYEMLHDYAENTDLFPHLHFCASSAAAGNIEWRFDWVVISAGREISELQSLFAIVVAGGLGANGRPIGQAFELGSIDGQGFKIGDQIRFRISRNPASVNDTYPDDALLIADGLHFRADSVGSAKRFSKT